GRVNTLFSLYLQFTQVTAVKSTNTNLFSDSAFFSATCRSPPHDDSLGRSSSRNESTQLYNSPLGVWRTPLASLNNPGSRYRPRLRKARLNSSRGTPRCGGAPWAWGRR